MAPFLLFPRLLGVFKWDLLFDRRKGLNTTGHSPSTGGRLEWALTHLIFLGLVKYTIWADSLYFQSIHNLRPKGGKKPTKTT
jgi:hypothetical protein